VRAAACADTECSVFTTSEVPWSAGGPLAMKIGRYGRPLVAHQVPSDGFNPSVLMMTELYLLDDFRTNDWVRCPTSSVAMVC
jgi:hypothetical protein